MKERNKTRLDLISEIQDMQQQRHNLQVTMRQNKQAEKILQEELDKQFL